MSKIAILGDTHFGARNGSEVFDNSFREFYDKVFFPELKKRNINSIIQLGDLFDNRKSTNLKILDSCNEYFFKPLEKYDFATLVGNHDSNLKNTIKINSQNLLLNNHPNWTIVDVPMHIGAGLALPWICDENYDDTMRIIKSSKEKFCFGHLELSGFRNNSHIMKDGLSHTIFKKFDRVFTGHYHEKQIQDNIYYTGTPYEMCWSDCHDTKGFHILDTDTGELEFIENPIKMHHIIAYTGKKTLIPDNINNKIIKVIVQEKDSQKNFDNFIERVYEESPYEVKIQESILEYDSENVDDVDLEIESTSNIIAKYIDNADVMVDKEKLKELLQTIYSEAEISA